MRMRQFIVLLLCGISLMTGCSASETNAPVSSTDSVEESTVADEVVPTEAEIDDIVEQSDDWWLEQCLFQSGDYAKDLAYGHDAGGGIFVVGALTSEESMLNFSSSYDWKVLFVPAYVAGLGEQSGYANKSDYVAGVAKDLRYVFGYHSVDDGNEYKTLRGLDGLRLVVIPNISTVGEGVFEGSSLERVVLGNGIKEIGDGAFMNCVNLKAITLPESLEILNLNAFAGTSISELYIPSSVKSLKFFDNIGFELIVDKGSYAHQQCLERGVEFTLSGKEVLGKYGVGEEVFSQLESWEQEYLELLTAEMEQEEAGRESSYSTYSLLSLPTNNIPSLVAVHHGFGLDENGIPESVTIFNVRDNQDFSKSLVAARCCSESEFSGKVGYDLDSNKLYHMRYCSCVKHSSFRTLVIMDYSSDTYETYIYSADKDVKYSYAPFNAIGGNSRRSTSEISQSEFDKAVSGTGVDILTLDYVSAEEMREYLIDNVIDK